MDLMEKIKEFLENDEIKNLFITNGYNTIITDDKVYLENKNKKTIEKMNILNDENNKNRIRFKGSNFAFSISSDEKGNLYLDHLLIGNVEQDEYDFIMRKEIIDRKTKITVKLVDDKNVKHIYKIKEDSISIERISIRKKFEEEIKKDNMLQKYLIEHFHLFKGKEKQIIIGNQDKEYIYNCLKEFLILEKSFIIITPYIEKRIPFLHDSIAYISEVFNNKTKTYAIKKANEKSEETAPLKVYKLKQK